MVRLLINNIPNFFTIVNSFLGFSSILASFQAVIEFYLSSIGESAVDSSTYLAFAGLFIIIATFFDFIDGMAARLLKVNSQIGKELDSFADLVSFGIAPGVLFFTVTMIATNHIPGTDIYYRVDWAILNSLLPHVLFLKILAFVFPTCVIYRLARFNIKSDSSVPSLYFEGVPSTFGGGFVALILIFNFVKSPAAYLLSFLGIKWSLMDEINAYFHPIFHDYFFLMTTYLLMSALMVSRIPYRKFSSIIKFFSKKKYILLHIIYVLLFLTFFRYTMLLSLVLYLILGIRVPSLRRKTIDRSVS